MNVLRKIGLFISLFILSAAAAVAQNINVTATSGTPNATYPTLTEAFSAVNAGTHTGAVTMDVVANTAEPANTSAVLNSSGAGAASYTSVLIRPTVNGVTITGAGGNGTLCGGKGLIELNGADNVTIDGDNPNTPGVNRNLILTSTCGNNQTSVIRIALATSGVNNTAHNNTFKNLVINGSVAGGNDPAVTDAGGPAGNSYGIFVGGGASTTATNPPSVMTSAVAIGSPATANNLTIDNNRITNAARGVSVVGSAVGVFPDLLISNNNIGNPTTGAADGIYAFGITANGTTGGVIRDNTVYVESYLATIVRGIDLGAGGFGTVNTGSSVVERNHVKRAKGNNPQGQGARGININTNFGQTVRNNFVSGVINTPTPGLFFLLIGGIGITIDRGPDHRIYNNTVSMSGDVSGPDPNLSVALAFGSASGNNSDARNNILINTQTQSGAANPAASAYVCLFLNTTAYTSSRNQTLNNNDYFQGTAVNSGIVQAGQIAGTGFYTAANFDPNTTTLATNFRAYSSQLTISGTNDNASTVVNPQLVSGTDLHLQPASPMINAGTDVLVFNDIDGQIRVNTPDIGADEADGAAPQQNDIAAHAFINPANGSLLGTTASTIPSASFANYGTATQSNVTVRYQIINSSNVDVYNQTATIASITQNQVVSVNFPQTTVAAAGTYTIRITSELAGDQAAANNTKNGTITVFEPVSGTVNVGEGQPFTSLTSPGGLFTVLNTAGAVGSVIVNITSDISIESGAVKLNQLPAGVTLTIKPSGAPRRISGSAPINTALIALNGADNITIDGSLNGGTDRSLTIDMINGVAILYLASGTNGAQNNTIKNLNLVSTYQFGRFGIFSGGNTLPSDGPDNDNNRFQNNTIHGGLSYGIVSSGANAANKNTGTVITQNVMTGTGPNRIRDVGIYVTYDDGAQITDNTISGIGLGGSYAIGIAAGIQNIAQNPSSGFEVSNAMIARNNIGSVVFLDTLSAVGIAVAGSSTGTNRVVNNVISGVLSNATGSRFSAGIFVGTAGGGTQEILYNSVSMTGDRGPDAYLDEFTSGSFGLVINGGDHPVNVRNNIFYNTQTSSSPGSHAKSYAIGIGYSTFANLTSNNNVLFTSGPQSKFALTGALRNDGTNAAEHTSLAAFRTTTGTDANSLALDPKFVSTTDLHIQTGAPTPVENLGTPIVDVTTDFDNETRHATTPDIGADEGNFTPLIPNDVAATVIVRPAPGELIIGGTSPSPVAVFTNHGSNTQTNVMVQFTITGPGGYNYSNTFSIASLTAGTSMSVLFNTAPPLTAAGTYTATATNLFSDSNTSNDSVSATFPVLLPLSGSYDVGEGGSYTSLTNAGGIFEALSIQGASDDVVINITSDLMNESALISLRDLPGDLTLTIKPSGGPRTISGGRAWGLIRLRGADNVTIDGSLNGGTDRSLTIINAQPLGSQQVNAAVIMIANEDAGGVFDGASNNTIKNCIIKGNNELLTEGIVAGDIILGLPAQQPNSNNTIQNNLITRVHNGIFILGNDAGNLDDNWVVSGNTIGSETEEEKTSFRGMLIANAKNFTVTRNTISGVFGQPLTAPAATAMVTGMQISGSLENGQVTRNMITDVRHPQFDAFGSFGANGIYITATSTNSNLSIANNMVSAVASHGSAFTGPFDNGYGIFVQSGGGYKLYNNTVNMNVNQTNDASITAAINIFTSSTATGREVSSVDVDGLRLTEKSAPAGGDEAKAITADDQTPSGRRPAADKSKENPAAENMIIGAIDLQNNILANPQTVGTRYAAYVSSSAGSSVFSSINYNDYFAQNVGFLNAAQPTLANWQTATGQDANSLSIDPVFASSSDLHLQRASTLINAGTPIAGITTDFDGQSRDATPDIGADEFVPPAIADFDGDGKTDIAVWRGATGEWFILNSGSGAYSTYTWGASGDQIVPGDYDGDGKTDVAAFRPSTGTWAILNSNGGTYSTYTWGASTDVPVAGDYDDDGRTDVAVWRPSTGEWIILKSSGGTQTNTWGAMGDVPLSGDFDGDGQTDLAVWRASTGEWFINRSTAGYVTFTWGVSTDRVVHADYDGDGKDDVAVWRPSTGEWSILRSSDGGYTTATWGASGDVPVPGDYDGDGRADISVFRNGIWHVNGSTSGYITASWGVASDVAIPAEYIP